jgi:hypothetical protein
MADGLYLGGFLNAIPEQFVRFSTEGVEVVSPTKIRLVAPTVEIVASTAYTVNSAAITETASGSITIDSPSNDIKGGGTKIDDKPFLTHAHSGVTPGLGTSGPVA